MFEQPKFEIIYSEEVVALPILSVDGEAGMLTKYPGTTKEIER